jgi:transposase
VVETLRFFLRDGVQWRALRARRYRICGATLRRRLTPWSTAALLRRVHAALVRRVRSGPEAAAATWDVIVDSCRVCAKRGGFAREALKNAERVLVCDAGASCRLFAPECAPLSR